jgi:hypothetical protein
MKNPELLKLASASNRHRRERRGLRRGERERQREKRNFFS